MILIFDNEAVEYDEVDLNSYFNILQKGEPICSSRVTCTRI